MTNKSITALTLFTIGSLAPLVTNAAPLGTWYDPIHVQIEQTPTNSLLQQQSVIRSKEEALKAQYGLSNYYSCVRSTGYLDKSGGPSAGIYLSFVRSCLERKTVVEERVVQQPQSVTCPPGTYLQNSICIQTVVQQIQVANSETQAAASAAQPTCEDEYGPNSIWTGKLNEQGGQVCGCAAGYVWSGKTCITVSRLCQNYYGSYSIWTGENDGNGAPICGCMSGYEFNTSSSACVKVQKSPVQGTAPENLLVPKLNDGLPVATDMSKQDVAAGRSFFSRLLQLLNPFAWF